MLGNLIILLLAFVIGFVIFELLSFRSEGRADMRKLFCVLFFAGAAYLLACYTYMELNGFKWLFSFDSINYYVPYVEEFVRYSNGSISKVFKDIFTDYEILSQDIPAYWLYTVPWAMLGQSVGADIYFSIQVSILFLYPFVGIMIFKLFQRFNIHKKALKYTLLICLFSIVFYYSSIILRDFHILLLYLIAINISLSEKQNYIRLILLIITIVITILFRVESGLFLALCIPVYLFATKLKNKYQIAISAFAGLFIVGYFFNYFSQIQEIYDTNHEVYLVEVETSSGIVNRLNSIPVIGNFLSIFYNACQPLPFWSVLQPVVTVKYGAEARNIMAFPRVFSAFFNVWTVVILSGLAFNRKLSAFFKSDIRFSVKMQVIIGVLFLYMQSTVMTQRRLMGYYCLYYVLAFAIYSQMNSKLRHQYNMIAVVLFVSLQIFGAIFLNS
ncbi:hypothetical protein [Pseudoprevotella muciniphila]|nr:hypothetical protein [Pseudoprevotella muciniphila]